MYCNKCGKEVKEDEKFCASCGTPVTEDKKTTEPNHIKKRVRQIVVTVLAMLGAYLIGDFTAEHMAASFLESSSKEVTDVDTKDKVKDASKDKEVDVKEQIHAVETTPEPNVAYTEIFTSRNIIEMPTLFSMMESASFAKVYENGMIEKMECGYEDDIVKCLKNTIYYPISDFDEEQINAFDARLRETFAPDEARDFCTVTYNKTVPYYELIVDYIYLDNLDNLTKVTHQGSIEIDGSGLLSMQLTEEALLANGYVKR